MLVVVQRTRSGPSSCGHVHATGPGASSCCGRANHRGAGRAAGSGASSRPAFPKVLRRRPWPAVLS